MSLIGAFRFIAPCVELLAFSVFALAFAGDCPPQQLSPADAQARVATLAQSAQRGMMQQNFAQAVRDLGEAACLDPGDPRILYGLGVAQAGSGDFLSARKSLAAAGRLQPDNPLPLAMLVRVNYSMGDVDSMKAALRDGAARFPRDGDLHATLAQFLVQKKLFDLALAESLRAQQASAHPSAQATMELAILENTVGAYDDAIRNAMLIERQPDLPAGVRASAAGVAGLSSQGANKPEQAIANLQQAIQLDPTQENSYVSLAFLYEKTNKYAQAVSVLEQGRSRLPGASAFLLPLGSNLVRVGRYRDAIATLRELLRRSPDEYEAYIRIADAYRQMGDHGHEVEVLRELASRKPDYPMIHVLISNAMFNMSPVDYPKLLDELALAETSDPSDAQVFYLRAKVYLATNQDEKARLALVRAIELAPRDPDPYYRLGRLLLKTGKPAEAKEAFARMQILKGNPSK